MAGPAAARPAETHIMALIAVDPVQEQLQMILARAVASISPEDVHLLGHGGTEGVKNLHPLRAHGI